MALVAETVTRIGAPAMVAHARAAYRVELALYGILPVSVLLLGLMVFWQVLPLFRGMVWLMNTLGS